MLHATKIADCFQLHCLAWLLVVVLSGHFVTFMQAQPSIRLVMQSIHEE